MFKGKFFGFWFAYIETLTGLASIFLIFFVAASNQERVISKRQERLVKSWQTAKEDLTKLNAEPVSDSKMGGMRITLADKILFALNSDMLNKNGADKIVEISKVLLGFYKNNLSFQNSVRIKVGGHTDRTGGDIVNFPLSYQRAKNVSDIIKNQFLLEKVNVDVTPIAYGSKYPLFGYDSDVEPLNRRTTIVIELLSTELLRTLNK